MNTPARISLVLTAFVALIATSSAQALDPPPSHIDYQGQLLNASGGPITGIGGPGTSGTPSNFEIRFRIWKSQTSTAPGDLIWAEKQIVTVDADGFFSVRLGEGEAIISPDGDPTPLVGTIPHAANALLGAFDGNERFVGVTVMNPPAVPGEIQPRLKFLSSPFAILAEKARFAESGPSGGVFSADQIGVGTTTPSSALHVAGSGSVHLLLEADTDNAGEGDQPTLTFSQDGGKQTASLGYFDSSDDFGIETSGSRRLTIERLGDVGIGTTNPSEDLHVVRPDTDVARIYATGTSQGGGMFYAGGSTAYGGGFLYEEDGTPNLPGNNGRTVFFARIGYADTELFSYDYNNVYFTGRIGIGTLTPTDSLTIGNSGSIRLNGGDFEPLGTRADGVRWVDLNGLTLAKMHRYGVFNQRLYITNAGSDTLSGVYLSRNSTSITSTSDERLKSEIRPITGILDKIKDIRVVDFNMAGLSVDPETHKPKVDRNRARRKTMGGKTIKDEIGTIAQDWLKDFPELVVEPENEDDYYGLAYDRIGVVAIGAAKELNEKVTVLEARVQDRDAKIADLEARLAALEALVSAAK